jgi:SNF2 family DNA or RNA helicase
MEYKFKEELQPKLNRFLAHSTIRFKTKDSDLPPYVPIVKKVSLPHDAEVYFEKLREVLRKSKGNYQEQHNAFIRMRQLSSGWIGYDDEEEGKRAQLEFDDKPKLDMLFSLLHSTDEKAIVFHDFTYSGSMICRELEKEGLHHCRIYGQTTEHDRILESFSHPNGPRVLVLNNKCVFGPNLQAARYGIFFESPVSPITRKQARRRFERQHSKHDKVFGIDLVTLGTYDQRILDMLAKGEDLFQAIIEGRAKP